jgi:hypothetical protein
VPASSPSIVWRRGLDLHPIDVSRTEDANWLLACVWADHDERRERLRAAIELARSNPVRVEVGDLNTDVPAILEEAPPDATVVVFHSAVLNYLRPDRRAAFPAMLAELSRRRDIVWITNEGPGVVPGLDHVAPHRPDLKFRLGRAAFSNGHGELELLGLAHPHGWDLEWLAPGDPG